MPQGEGCFSGKRLTFLKEGWKNRITSYALCEAGRSAKCFTKPLVSKMTLSTHGGPFQMPSVSKMTLSTHGGPVQMPSVSKMTLSTHGGSFQMPSVSKMALTAHHWGVVKTLRTSTCHSGRIWAIDVLSPHQFRGQSTRICNPRHRIDAIVLCVFTKFLPNSRRPCLSAFFSYDNPS